MKSFILLMLGVGVLSPACARASAADHVHPSHAWIRVLPGGLPAGAYLTLTNDGDEPAVLERASSPSYAQVMLHHSSTTGGMSRMTSVDSLSIPAHGAVSLAPAGYHLMLMQSNAPVKAGDTVRVVLDFADGSSLPTAFIARPANAMDDGRTSKPASPDPGARVICVPLTPSQPRDAQPGDVAGRCAADAPAVRAATSAARPSGHRPTRSSPPAPR